MYAECADLSTRLLEMIEAIREYPLTREAWIFYVLERNMGHANDHAAKVAHLYRVKMVYEQHKEEGLIPGIYTHGPRKNILRQLFSAELEHDSIRIPEQGIVLSQFSTKRKEVWQNMWSQLCEQLMNMRPDTRNTVENRVSEGSYSGKIGPDGKLVAGRVDDLAMSLLIGNGEIKEIRDGRRAGININELSRWA